MKTEKIKRRTYIKLSLRLRNTSGTFFFRIITINDIASFLLGFLFFFSMFIIKNEHNIDYSIAQFYILTVATISLFVVQRENFIANEEEKNNLFLVAPISKNVMKKMDLLINWISVLKCVLSFMLVYVVYFTFIYGPIFLVFGVFSIVFITVFSYFVSEIIKIVVLFSAKNIVFLSKIKNYILVLILTVLYYYVNSNVESVVTIRFFPTNVLSNVLVFSYSKLAIDGKYLGYSSIIMVVSILINYFIFTKIKIASKVKKNVWSDFPTQTYRTYQEDAISGIVNSMIKNDEETSSSYLENSVKIFTSLAWSMLVLSLIGIFSSFYEILIVSSVVTTFRSSSQILSFMYSRTPAALEQFKIYPTYSDQIISKTAAIKVMKSKFVLVILPLVIVTMILSVDNLMVGLLIVLNYLTVFFGGVYINYKYLKKYKPFFYSKNSDNSPSELLPNLIYITLLVYTLTIFPILEFSYISLLVLPTLFITPSIFLMLSLSKKDRMFVYPSIKQADFNDCGVACAKNIAAFYGRDFGDLSWDLEYGKNKYYGASFKDIYDMGSQVGLVMEGYKIDDNNILVDNVDIHPYIAHVTKNNISHFVVVYETQKNRIIMSDPAKNGIHTMSFKKFQKIFNGNILIKSIENE